MKRPGEKDFEFLEFFLSNPVSTREPWKAFEQETETMETVLERFLCGMNW